MSHPRRPKSWVLEPRGPGQWEALRRSWARLEAQRAGLDARSGHREVKEQSIERQKRKYIRDVFSLGFFQVFLMSAISPKSY